MVKSQPVFSEVKTSAGLLQLNLTHHTVLVLSFALKHGEGAGLCCGLHSNPPRAQLCCWTILLVWFLVRFTFIFNCMHVSVWVCTCIQVLWGLEVSLYRTHTHAFLMFWTRVFLHYLGWHGTHTSQVGFYFAAILLPLPPWCYAMTPCLALFSFYWTFKIELNQGVSLLKENAFFVLDIVSSYDCFIDFFSFSWNSDEEGR